MRCSEKIGGQFERSFISGKVLLPISESGRKIKLPLPSGEIGILNRGKAGWRRPPFGVCGIIFLQFRKENVLDRPAVRRDMMNIQKQEVTVFTDNKKPSRENRSLFEVENMACILIDMTGDITFRGFENR